MNNRENMYDVETYTDAELLDILDLNNPTDRELEAKIVSLIRKYENMQNQSGDKLAKFFDDIYKHFFDLESDDESDDQDILEGFDDIPILVRDLSMQTVAGYKYDPETSINSGQTRTTQDPNKIRENIEKQKQEILKDPKQSTQRDPNLLIQGPTSQPSTTQIGYTKSLDYTQDKLNPLLQQTIKRVISIDSQYRDNKRSLSTEFTFNLSDPLKDVVSMKLYSVQIPYTWYTINNNFGSNFFYLKGNSNGINNGNHDYIIDILAGNYSPTELSTAVNNRISLLTREVTDVSFGTTKIEYDQYTSLSKMTVDIKKQYNETSYYLKFPYWTESNNNTPLGPRFKSIPAFLGFDNIDNYPYIINSSKTLQLSTNTSSISEDDISRKFYVYTTTTTTQNVNKNNYFTIIKYHGPDEYQSGISKVDFSFNITLTIQNDVTRSELVADLSNQLASNSYLSRESSIKRIDITDSSKNNVGNSYFELKIKPNRNTTNNFTNSKIAILFPTEISQSSYSNIWTGLNSCFRFETLINETNNILSDVAPIKQESINYLILSKPYIYLKCKATGYNIIKNDLSFTLTNSAINGYSLTDYMSVINSSIKLTNDNTKNIRNITGDINETNTKSYIGTDSKFHIQFDINKKFNQDKYTIDISNSFLSTVIGYDKIYNDLSSSNIFNSSFIQNASYTLDGSYIAIISPKIKIDNYVILSNPYIYLKSKATGFNLPVNDISFTLINSQSNGYSLTDYISAINDSIIRTNNNTKNIRNITGDINETNTKSYIGTDSKFHIQFDINKKFNQDKYIIDISDSFLSTVIGYDKMYYDLSSSNIFNSSFNQSASYTLDGSYIAIIDASRNGNYGNQNQAPYLVPLPTQRIYTTYQTLQTAINNSFNNFIDPSNGLNVLSGTNVNFTLNPITSKIDCSLTIIVQKTLTERDYSVQFIDPQYDTTYPDTIYSSSSWYKYLNVNRSMINTEYDLSNAIVPDALYSSTSGNTLSLVNYGNQNQAPYLVPLPTQKTYTTYQTLQTAINNSFNNFIDPSNGLNVLSGTNVNFTLNPTTLKIDCSLTIVVQKILTERDYSVQFVDPSYDSINYPATIDVSSSWYKYLHIESNMINTDYDLSNSIISNSSYSDISGTSAVEQNTITITSGINDTIQIVPNEEGVNGSDTITITIPSTTYTRDNLIKTLNNSLNSIPIASNSYFYIKNTNGIERTIIRMNINKLYTANDYRVVFYDPFSFIKCYVGVTSVRNTTWDTTLGWVLGFRLSTEYMLSDYGSGQIIFINGDTGVSTNLFNYFMICLDDYNQNHLNDGLVTVTSKVTDIPLPSYVNKSNFQCDPASGLLTYNTTSSVASDLKLTQNQLYALTQIANERKSIATVLSNNTTINTKSYGSGPFVKDVFGLIPLKLSGLYNGTSYVEFGGTLQNQERLYFGPVNIHRMTVKLVSDRGDVVDLNGANWSFSLICEQLYKQQPTGSK